MTFILWNRWRNIVIESVGLLEPPKHMGARRPLAPALVQEYFQQSSLKKPIPTNKVFTIKILTKGAPITGRCHSTYSCTVMLLCVVVLTYKGTTRYSTNSQLGTSLWLSPATTSPDIWVPLTENGSHSMLQQKATVTTFRGEVLRYSHVATTFPIYYCTLKTVAMTCHYNIFSGKTRYHTVQSVLLPGRCSQAGLNHTVAIGRENKTLTTVKILISMCELTRFK